MCVKVIPAGVELQPIPKENIHLWSVALKPGVRIFVKLSRCVPSMTDNHCVFLEFRREEDESEEDGFEVRFEKNELPLALLPLNSAVLLSDLIRPGYTTDTLVDLALSKLAAINAMVSLTRTGLRCAKEVMIQLRVKEFFTCRRVPCADMEHLLTFF